MTASCLGLIVFSRAASFDVVVTMTTTWSLAFFLLHELPTTKQEAVVFGRVLFVCGFVATGKGLVGIVIPFGVVGFYYSVKTTMAADFPVWLSSGLGEFRWRWRCRRSGMDQ